MWWGARAVVVLGLLFLSGCAQQNELPPQAAGDWVLSSATRSGVAPSSAWGRIDPAITLSISGNSLVGNAGCNTYSLGDSSGSLTLPLTNIVATRMACKAASVMERESTYLDILSRVDTVSVSDNELVMRDADAELRFRRLTP